jgi:hypothetical protein
MVVNKKEKFFADLDEISGWKLINHGEVLMMANLKIKKVWPITAGILKSKRSLFA